MATSLYTANELTGGTSSCLDDISHSGLSDNDLSMVIDVSNDLVYFYKYDSSSSAAESSPDVIQPDSNSGNGRWLLFSSFATLTGTESLSNKTLITPTIASITGNSAVTGTLDIGASTTKRVAPSGTFVNNADGRPVVSTTKFTYTTDVTESTWESVGPTGGGADHAWTALDSVPSDADWILVRGVLIGTEENASSNRTGDVYVRANGASVSVGDDSKVLYLTGSYSISPCVGTSQASNLSEFVVPLSSRVFDIYWNTDFTTSETGYLYLVGWGFNP